MWGRLMRALRWVLGAVGVLAAAYGVLLLLRQDLADVLDSLLWLVGGAVLHDAVVAPLTVLATVLLLRVVPRAWRSAVTVGAVVLLTVTATAVPVLGRFGVRADNPTLLDRDYTSGWLVLAALSLVVVLVVRLLGTRRSGEGVHEQGDRPQ